MPNNQHLRPKLLADRELNIIRGKVMAGHASAEDVMSVFGHLDMLEVALDDCEGKDMFGPEGWRHYCGLPE